MSKYHVTNALPCVDSTWNYVESRSDALDLAIDILIRATGNANVWTEAFVTEKLLNGFAVSLT